MAADNVSQIGIMSIYRQCTLGGCLQDAIRELREEDRLSLEMENKIMLAFDVSINQALEKFSKENAKSSCTIEGTKSSQNQCEGIWQIDANKLTVTTANMQEITTEKVKFLAVPKEAIAKEMEKI